MPSFGFTYWKEYPDFPADWEDNPEDRWFLTHDGHIKQDFWYRGEIIPPEYDFLPTPGRTFQTATPDFNWYGVGAEYPGVDYSNEVGPQSCNLYLTGIRPSDGKEVCVAEGWGVIRGPGSFGFKAGFDLELSPLAPWSDDLLGRLWRPTHTPLMYPEEPVDRWMPVDPDVAVAPFRWVQVVHLVYGGPIDSDGPINPPIPTTNFEILGVSTADSTPAAGAFVAPRHWGYIGRTQS